MPSTTNSHKHQEQRPVDAATEDDEEQATITCCACMSKRHVSFFSDSLDINEPIFHGHICNGCIDNLTVYSPGGIYRVLKEFGRPTNGPAGGNSTGALNVDLGNGVRVSVMPEQEDSRQAEDKYCQGVGPATSHLFSRLRLALNDNRGYDRCGVAGGKGGAVCAVTEPNTPHGSFLTRASLCGGFRGGGSSCSTSSSTSSASSRTSSNATSSASSSTSNSPSSASGRANSSCRERSSSSGIPKAAPLPLAATEKVKLAQPSGGVQEEVEQPTGVRALTLAWSRRVAQEKGLEKGLECDEEISSSRGRMRRRELNKSTDAEEAAETPPPGRSGGAAAATVDLDTMPPGGAAKENKVKARIEFWSRQPAMSKARSIAAASARPPSPSSPPAAHGADAAPPQQETSTPGSISSGGVREVGAEELASTPIVGEGSAGRGRDEGQDAVPADAGRCVDDSTKRYERRLLHCGLGFVGVVLVGTAVWALGGRRFRR